MKLAHITSAVCLTAALLLSSPLLAAKPLQYDDVFELEFVSDPQPDSSGKNIVFVRNWMDRSTDRRRTSLWLSTADGKSLQALTDKNTDASSPRWGPDNNRIAFIADGQIYLKWLDSGRTSQLGQLQQRPANLRWSPDGNWLAFTMFTPRSVKPPVALPGKPENADWAKAPVYIDSKQYRADGAGYLKAGYQHIYLMPANGGSAIQLTDGDFNHGAAVSCSRDSKAIYFSANRHADWQAKPLNS